MTILPAADSRQPMTTPRFAVAIDQSVHNTNYPEQYYAFQENVGETFQVTECLFDPDMFFKDADISTVDGYIQQVFNVCKIGLLSNIKLSNYRQGYGNFYGLYASGMRHIYRQTIEEPTFIAYNSLVDMANIPTKKNINYNAEDIVNRIVDFNILPSDDFDKKHESFANFGKLINRDSAFYASPVGQNTVLALGFEKRASEMSLLNALYQKQNGHIDKDTLGSKLVWQSNYFIKKGLTKYALAEQVPIFVTYFPSSEQKHYSFKQARECFEETGRHHSAVITNPLSEPYAWLNAKNIKHKQEAAHPLFGGRELNRIDQEMTEMKQQFQDPRYIERLQNKLDTQYPDRAFMGIPYPATDTLSWKIEAAQYKTHLARRKAKKDHCEPKSPLTNGVKPYNNMGIQPGGQFLAP